MGTLAPMPRLDAVLPRLSPYLPAPFPQFDPAPHPVTAIHVWLAVDAALAEHAGAAAGRAEWLTELALEDLVEADSRRLLPAATASAARVCAVLGVAGANLASGDPDRGREWIVRGLGGGTDAVTQFTLDGPIELLRLAHAGDARAQDAVGRFAAVLFYLHQHAGYLIEVVEPLAEGLILALLAMPPSEAACAGGQEALTWAYRIRRNDWVEPLGTWCLEAAEHVTSVEQAVGLLFAVAITRTGTERQRMLVALRAALPQQLPPQLRLQVMIAAMEQSRPTPEELHDVLTLISAHRRALEPYLDEADLARRQERTFSTIGPLMASLSQAGAALDAVRVLQSWTGAPDDPAPVDCLLLEHTPEGVRYVWPDGTWLAPAPSDASALDKAVNAALGTALASTSDPTHRVHAAATGQLDRPSGIGLEQAARQTLHLAPPPAWAGRLTDQTLLVPVPGHRIPYQALFSADGHPALRLWTSLRPPREERWLQRVVLLEGDTDMASVEATLVTDILTGAGFDVDHFHGESVSARAFAAHHRDPAVDVLWLTCHGRQPAYSPETASLLLTGGEELSSDDLRIGVPDADQRLLVLNSCDGAATVTAGGLRARGLAAEAAGPSQAVIGHQWAVREKAAATFGALLACGLADHRGIAAAFNAALKGLHRPWRDLVGTFEEHGARSELVAQLTPPADGYGDNILDWGSPALYC